MSAISTTCRRTISRTSSLPLTAFMTGLFLAAIAALFACRLDAAEGLRQSVVIIWVLSVSQLLPVFTAFIAMDTWSGELSTRRIDLLLSIAVRERDYVLGKILGIWLMGAIVIVISLAVTILELSFLAPSSLSGVYLSSVIPSLLILLIQNFLWSSAAVAFSSLFRRAFAAAIVSILVLVILPRAIWYAFLLWAPQGASAFGEFPLDAHVVDFASGIVSTGIVVPLLVLAVLAQFIATRVIVRTRYLGFGSSGRRWAMTFSALLALAGTISIAVLSCRLNLTLELPVKGGTAFSPRMRHILSEASGEMSVTAFIPRSNHSFRMVSRFLRMLKRQADASMGLDLTVRFVDPKWDLGQAERLVRRGAKEFSLVFEKGHRSVVLPVDEGVDDRVVASAIQRLAMPPQRRDVYWTIGHGESAFDSYGTWGMSDIARELVRNGYRNATLDLASEQSIPTDCALIIVAGAKTGFSRTERTRLDAYLKRGGRLLALVDSSGEGGIVEMLPAWGVRFLRQPIVGARTLSGTDVVASDFADHPLSSPLKGSQVVLDRPLSFLSLAAGESALGADRLNVTPLVSCGTSAIAMAIERGATAGSDLALRPTRIIVIGDASFVMNGQLSARANANRDFFLNSVAYLSGTDAMVASGQDADILATGLDRRARIRFALISVGVMPFVIGLMLLVFAVSRRSSK